MQKDERYMELEGMTTEQLIFRIMKGFSTLKAENQSAYLSWLRDRQEEEADALAILLECWMRDKAKAQHK